MDISNRRQNGNSIIKVDRYYNLSDMQNKSVTLETIQLILYILAGSLGKTTKALSLTNHRVLLTLGIKEISPCQVCIF